jgi:Na+/glutamate symporter
MKPSPAEERRRKRPPTWLLNTLTALVGLLTLALGVGWLIRSWIVDMEIPYFAIPLVMCVPVIVAVAFRNIWD